LIKTGSLEVETAGGHKFTLGDGSGRKLGLRFNDSGAIFKLMADPELQFGELYMDDRIEVTEGMLFDGSRAAHAGSASLKKAAACCAGSLSPTAPCGQGAT
jgi:hypothetical protein